MKNELKVGLLAGESEVPLEGVRIDARLAGACTEVTVTQRYRNREAVPVEAVYVFPLEERAAVCGFAAVVAGKVIRGRVDERDAAFAEYDDAMARGDGAFLLDQERPNVFTASVGNLRPGEAVELQIRYVSLAAREGDAIRLTIPTTVSPRYVPSGPAEVGQPDGERVNPPHWPKVPYGLTLAVNVAGTDLRRIESPSHPIRTTANADATTVELSHEDAALDRDFVLLVERTAKELPVARVARESDGRRVAMVTFLPQFSAEALERGHEVLFLLDCSGSMAGESIDQARRALSLCVRALLPQDTFNVVRFGSDYQSLWKAPRRYDDDTLEEATKYIAGTDANLGGTEILKPLQALLQSKRDAERPRRVLLLTDGQVSNEDDVLALAREHAADTRIFTFGIGAGASEHLVKGAARASRGASEMIFPGERIEPKVLRTFERVRMPAYDDARIDWKGMTVEQAPARVPPVFAGDVLTVFARIESGGGSEVALEVGGKVFLVALDLERAESGGPIPTLWARETILELDDQTQRRGSNQKRANAEDRHRARLVELGKRYGLASSATSFVAIEERPVNEQVTPPAALRTIPVALTSGWGGGQRVGRPPMAMMAGAMPPLLSSPVPMAPMRFSAPAPAAAPPPPPGFWASAKRAVFGEKDEGEKGGAPPPVAVIRGAIVKEAEDPMYRILLTQSAGGHFKLNPFVAEWLGADRAERLKAQFGKVSEAVAVTAVIVALLERDHRDRESEWRPAVVKAKAWLAKQPVTFDANTVL
jgi:Ca-activated chloride channel family protein